MNDIGVQGPIESQGVFWLPNKPDEKKPGLLSHVPSKGTALSLTGAFTVSLLSDSFPAVYGTIESGACTLFDCTITSAKGKTGGLNQTALRVGHLAVGCHLVSMDERVFDTCTVRFDILSEWINFPAVLMSRSPLPDSATPSNISFSNPEPCLWKLPNDLGSVSLFGRHSGKANSRNVEFRHEMYLKIHQPEHSSIKEMWELVRQLRSLLALLTWQQPLFEYVAVSRTAVGSNENSEPTRVGLYGRWKIGQSEGKPGLREFLTQFQKISADMPVVIYKWFELSPQLRLALNLFTGVFDSANQFLEFQFLALMQAVEALHRTMWDGFYMKAESYKAVQAVLTSAIPKEVEGDHRTSLANRIKFGNEYSLRKRLTDTFHRIPKELRSIVAPDWKKFVSDTVELRNTLTHPGTEGYKRPEAQALWESAGGIKLLLSMIVLQELGLPPERVQTIANEQDWNTLIF